MATLGSVCAWFIIAIILSEHVPEVVGSKHKRTVPAFVHRGQYMPNYAFDDRSEYDAGSGWTSLQFPSLQSKTKAMEELLEVLGLTVPDNLAEFAAKEKMKKPPKYMVDLYNAIADDNGITRNPGFLDADTVRSIPNLGPQGSKFCKFDISAVTHDEVIIDAELHLFQGPRNIRKLHDNRALHAGYRRFAYPSTYVVRIYQLLSEYNSTGAEKTLISARRVHIHHRGWHMFSILPTVARWISTKAPNYGLVTEITSTSGAAVENVPGRESLQPLLVVFTNNTRNKPNSTRSDSERDSASEDEEMIRERGRQTGGDVGARPVAHGGFRSKRSVDQVGGVHDEVHNGRDGGRKPKRGKPRRKEAVARNNPEEARASNSRIPEEYIRYGRGRTTNQQWTDEYVYSDSDSNDGHDYFSDVSNKARGQARGQGGPTNPRFRYDSFTADNAGVDPMRSCRRYPLYVSFEELGWSGWIIHPQGYNAYHCKGVCSFPLRQQLNPTNHATVQSIMHTLGLGSQPVSMPCCAPGKLYDINLLYFDHSDYVVLRRYKDMVAASCACR